LLDSYPYLPEPGKIFVAGRFDVGHRAAACFIPMT
jgi:hypothetical protein